MNIIFQDLQHEDNPHNSQVLSSQAGVAALLDELVLMQPPFMCQFTSDSGANLTVGIARDFGCAQYSPNETMGPYWMALPKNGGGGSDMIFFVADTATPIAGRYRLAWSVVKEVVASFVVLGLRSNTVNWEEI